MLLLILNINKLNFHINVIAYKGISQYTTHTQTYIVFFNR
jgi:hypothetical protein